MYFMPLQVQDEDPNVHEMKTRSSISCSEEKHHFILDDEIGIICKFCSFVSLKIKHMLPPLVSSIFLAFLFMYSQL